MGVSEAFYATAFHPFLLLAVLIDCDAIHTADLPE